MAPFVCGGSVVAVLLLIISRDYPLVGHDFGYFIPRLLDTDLHLRINGLSIQWYTPSFGGGLPAFPNAQHLEFSLLQALLYVTSPWVAVLLTTAIVSAVGYAALYRFLSETLGLERIASTLGAAFFVGNGFYIEHMIVGHVGFQLFPLGAVILYALTNRTLSTAVAASLAALSTALMIHHAGAFIVILTAGAMVLAVPVLYLIDRARLDWARAIRTCAIAAPLALALAGSKLFATQSLMRQFPRELSDAYPVGVLQGLFGFGSQLAGGMMIIPILLLGRYPPQRLDDALINATGAGVHVWELDTGISPVLAAVLLIGCMRWLRSIRKQGVPSVEPGTAAMLVVLAVTSWIAIETTLAKGFIYPVVRELPVFRSLHVNHRVAAVFILPLAIIGAALLSRWHTGKPPGFLTAAAFCVTLASPLSYLVLPPHVHRRIFDITQSLRDHERIKQGEQFPITRIEGMQDFETFSARASNVEPYEPLFGYNREQWAARTHIGDIRDERDGAFNMTNPASMVFPELNQARPFDLIRASDGVNLDRFAARRQPDWPIPRIAYWLNLVSLASLVSCAGILVAGAYRKTR
jgi:hypothetical protein